jgi:hypothetical protein
MSESQQMVDVWIRTTQDELAKTQEAGRFPETGQQYEFDTTRPQGWLSALCIRVPVWDLDPFVSDRASNSRPAAVTEPLRRTGLIHARALNALLERGLLLAHV